MTSRLSRADRENTKPNDTAIETASCRSILGQLLPPGLLWTTVLAVVLAGVLGLNRGIPAIYNASLGRGIAGFRAPLGAADHVITCHFEFSTMDYTLNLSRRVLIRFDNKLPTTAADFRVARSVGISLLRC